MANDVISQILAQLPPAHQQTFLKNLAAEASVGASPAARGKLTLRTGLQPARTSAQQPDVSAPDNPGGSEWEDMLSIAPILKRDRTYRLVLLGNKVTCDANGNGQFGFAPAVPFLARRMVVAEGTAGFVANLQVGVDPIHVSATPEPLEMFSDLSDAGLLDAPVCMPGIKIGGQITSAGANAVVYAVMIGFALDKPASPLRGRLMRQAIPTTALAANQAGVVISMTTAKRFRPRRIAIDSTQTNIGQVVVTDFRIANVPQLLSSDPMPILAFAEKSAEGLAYLDLDETPPGVPMTLTVTNTAANTPTVQGVIEGDSV